jgi:hypothetical protein
MKRLHVGAWARSLRRACCLVVPLAYGLAPTPSSAAADLGWDLGYQAVLADHHVPDNEFLRTWLTRYPKRLIQDKLATYAGEAIEASVLIDMPDLHAGEPLAMWVVKTRNTAQACDIHPKFAQGRCTAVDVDAATRFVEEVMNFAPMRYRASDQNVAGRDKDGRPMLMNYLGVLSVYLDGKRLQRPLLASEFFDQRARPDTTPDPEAGRLGRAMSRLMHPARE